MNKYQKWFTILLILILSQIIFGLFDFELGLIFVLMDLIVVCIFCLVLVLFCIWVILEDL